jgi:hypothetical protein
MVVMMATPINISRRFMVAESFKVATRAQPALEHFWRQPTQVQPVFTAMWPPRRFTPRYLGFLVALRVGHRQR